MEVKKEPQKGPCARNLMKVEVELKNVAKKKC